MEKTSYHCDQCKKKVENAKDLEYVSYGIYDYNRGFDSRYPKFKVDMCQACRVKIGLTEIVLKDNKAEEREIKTTAEEFYQIVVRIFEENFLGQEGE